MLQFTGDDALLVLWNADTGEQIQEISCPFNGPITSIVWLPMQQGAAQAFAFGCSDGSLQVYAQINQQVSCSSVRDIINSTKYYLWQPLYSLTSYTSAHEGPIEDIAFEQTHHRLASVGHGALQVWTLNGDCKFIVYL